MADGEKSAELETKTEDDSGQLGEGCGPSGLVLAKYSMHIGDYYRNR